MASGRTFPVLQPRFSARTSVYRSVDSARDGLILQDHLYILPFMCIPKGNTCMDTCLGLTPMS